MSRERSHKSKVSGSESRQALAKYLTELEKFYPDAKGAAKIVTRLDGRTMVNIPLPTRASERMRLFDHMSEIGTRLLLETDQYIILSSR
jgi:hypothetical protein